ncbi:hypothetical protein E6W39_21945 [Kitasatospora acidiphila]|uniref:Uncharacterized protein n=1 Tax=Kitasatospora acidiphila TaxID=2567942 RepID=A0A540W5V5_9ACTN|nr:hypothetical protein [Kitasatospora acidiphila]TQF04396.1 hypothetical protein E6W39_21945 [Kitasatospora acidiphila]
MAKHPMDRAAERKAAAEARIVQEREEIQARAASRRQTEPLERASGLTQAQLDANIEAARETSEGHLRDLIPDAMPFQSARPVYIIKHAVHNVLKIGVGGSLRIQQHIGRGWLLQHLTAPTLLSREIEQNVLAGIRAMGIPRAMTGAEMPQGGASETMSGDRISISEVWELVQQEYQRLTELLAVTMGAHPERLEIVASVDDHLSIYGLGHSLPELLDRIDSGKPTILHQYGRKVAAIVPIHDFYALHDATDEMAARDAEAHRNDPDTDMVDVLAVLLGESARRTVAPAAERRRALSRSRLTENGHV